MIYEYKGKIYPTYLKNGNAVGHIEKIALHFCQGKGLDIGGMYSWVLPGAIPINIMDDILPYDAYNLPETKDLDYIFSSHCLEHLEQPIDALQYWLDHIKSGGTLFVYLPSKKMEYWLPENNKKHLQLWDPIDMVAIFKTLGLKDITYCEQDGYWSYFVCGFKK